MPPMARCSANIPRNAACICRSRRFRKWSSTPFWLPRTRISTSAAASLVYFDKSVNELTIAEAAYLAALPKAPAALHPVRNRDRAIERRNYVVDRLLENGWIKQADADKARKEALNVTNRTNGAHIF